MDNQFEQLGDDIRHIKDLLKHTSQTIMDQDVSSFPIFVVFQRDNSIELGVPIANESSNPGFWMINASTLEEFSARQIIPEEKLEDFKSVFKDPQEYFCLFLIDKGNANFVFLPQRKIP